MTDGVLHISPGDVVSGLEPDDLVEVQRIAPFGNKRLVEGVGMESRRVIKRPLSDEEISRLVVVRGKAHSFNGDPSLFLLAAEAERIRIAYQFDPLFAVNSSIVDPLPHQVEAVYRYLLPLPRIRFLLAEDHMGLRTTSPSYLLNCVPPENNPELPDLPERSVEEIQSFAYEKITEGQFEQVKAARVEECNLRRDYLNNAFADLIMELQGELNDLQQASLFGDQNADERERLERRIEELKNRKIERLNELQLMERLTGNLPDVLTQAVVMPPPVAVMETDEATPGKGFPMRRDDEVEAIAMRVAMRYERSRGWNPFDVSGNGEHFDIRSELPAGEKRFIEVKGRAQSGAIVITGPELDKLRQLGERAWLYVITFCKAEKPKLRVIQDPISKLNPEMLYRQVQYLVDERDWGTQGQEILTKPGVIF